MKPAALTNDVDVPIKIVLSNSNVVANADTMAKMPKSAPYTYTFLIFFKYKHLLVISGKTRVARYFFRTTLALKFYANVIDAAFIGDERISIFLIGILSFNSS